MTKMEEASKLFLEDKFHCSQAVLAVFPEYIDKDFALKISSCFGGGMRKGEVCGTVCAALMILGIAFGYSDKDDLESKKKSNELASRFMDRFKNEFNSYLCRDLNINGRAYCAKYVEFAVWLVMDFIESEKNNG